MNIPKSEHIILEILWISNPLTVGQIIERAQNLTDWHDNTVKTILTRLTKKKAIERFKDGKRFFYAPLISREEVIMVEAEGFLSRFFDGKMAPLIAEFAKSNKLTSDDIKNIEDILNKMKKK